MKTVTATPESFNFGELEKGSIAEKEITLTNNTQETVRLTTFKSCGCTEPVLGKNLLQPGDDTTMKILFNTTGKSGYQEKSVGVFYYVGGNALQTTITFKAKIKK